MPSKAQAAACWSSDWESLHQRMCRILVLSGLKHVTLAAVTGPATSALDYPPLRFSGKRGLPESIREDRRGVIFVQLSSPAPLLPGSS